MRILWLFLLAISIIGIQETNAQRKKKKDEKETVTPKPTPPSKKDKTIEELTKSSKKIEGLFTIFQDTVSGDLKMLIKKDQLDKDYIYFSQIADGVTEAGKFRGAYSGSSIFHIKKYFNKIDFYVPNTSFFFDENNPISRASDQTEDIKIVVEF